MVSVNRLSFVICFFVCLILWQLPWSAALADELTADELTAEQVAENLQKTFRNATTFTADFVQITTLSGLIQRKRHGEGTLVVKRPHFIRWDYHLPSEQVLISDGRNMTFYLAAEKQMITTMAEPYLREDITYTFLTGGGDILRDFKVSLVINPTLPGKNYKLLLNPRQLHPQVQSIKLWLDRQNFLIKRLQMFDHLGTITDIALYNVKVNEPVSNERFVFVPPPDTEIINQ